MTFLPFAVPLQVVMTGNGALAVEQFARGSFDAVVLDINMPVLDGAHYLFCA